MMQNRGPPSRPLQTNNSAHRPVNHHAQSANRPGHITHTSHPNNSNRPQRPANSQPQQPAQVPLPNVLPKGWKKEEKIRTKGITAGLSDISYVCTSDKSELAKPGIAGKKFKSKVELNRIFGEKYDTSLLDFKRGKISQLAYRKFRRNKNLQANPQNFLSLAKYDNCLTLPTRQTGSIIKQTVSFVTNNHKNEETPNVVSNFQTYANNPNSLQSLSQNQINVLSKNLEKCKPNQLFWEFHFSNLNSKSAHLIEMQDEIKDDYKIDLFNKLKNVNVSDENAIRSVAVSWYLNQNKALVGQDPKEFEKNSRVFFERDQPLIPLTKVKEEDLKTQENKIKELRKAIQQAISDYEDLDIEFFEKELRSLNEELFEQDCVEKSDTDSIKNEMQIDEEVVEAKEETAIENAA
ncbi:Methyl- -binding domain 2 [Brachionus plicatilis]|uniref:Methyl--binding domain 2 n=1 Tax=Brachionus plicatilis TaxID=10195 RepID=A0A3M7RZ39_BRAPC|nr:Methyl- -binding domain 2 [Brachionus plicatilis]